MARYHGGPCDGQTAPASIYATQWCGNVKYIQGETGEWYAPGYLPTFSDSPQFQAGRRQLDAAWRNLMRAYGITMHRALLRSASGRRRMKRAVR